MFSDNDKINFLPAKEAERPILGSINEDQIAEKVQSDFFTHTLSMGECNIIISAYTKYRHLG